jgi:hypothetical protein
LKPDRSYLPYPNPVLEGIMSENIVLTRVYKHTIQRLVTELNQLNSSAAYLFVCTDPINAQSYASRVFVWVGSKCSTEDALYSEQMALCVIEDDFDNLGHMEIIYEGKEDESEGALNELMEALWLTASDYYALENTRKVSEIQNKPMSLGVIERRKGSRELRMKVISQESTLTNGAVRPLFFSQIMTTKTVVVVVCGDVYDVLIGNDVTKPEQAAVKLFIINYALESVSDEQKTSQAAQFASKNLKIYKREGPKLFKSYFRSDTLGALNGATQAQGRAKSKSPPNPLNRKAVKKTNIFSNKCTDCVGDTIMSLLGMRADNGAEANTPDHNGPTDADESELLSNCSSDETSSMEDFEYAATLRRTTSSSSTPAIPISRRKPLPGSARPSPSKVSAPSPLSKAVGSGDADDAEGGFMDITGGSIRIPYVADAEDLVPDESSYENAPAGFDPMVVSAKIARAQLRTNIQYMNPPRKGMCLLVLDLDHTLMDFSQRFHTKNVMRPHLLLFLKEVSVKLPNG